MPFKCLERSEMAKTVFFDFFGASARNFPLGTPDVFGPKNPKKYDKCVERVSAHFQRKRAKLGTFLGFSPPKSKKSAITRPV